VRLGFKVVGVPEAADALDQLSDEMAGQHLADSALAGGNILVNGWKDEVSFVTGEYKRNIHAEVTHQSRDRAEVTVGPGIMDPNYPYVLEYGMTIKAKHAPYLHFKTKDGQWVRKKQVTIPPFGWARKAFDKHEDAAAREVEEALLEKVGLIWR